MPDKKPKQRRHEDKFFWKIPGDVPGWSSQPDPYQGTRDTRDPDYQGTSRVSGGDANTQTQSRTGGVRRGGGVMYDTDGHAPTADSKKSSKWWLLLALLLIGGGAFVGYYKYTSAPTAQIAKAKKVFEITLGAKNKTAKSRVRIITHVVVKGDTLWDIAKKYVKDPFRYPELAKLSRIKNPDLIYPYDIVRIRIFEAPEK